MDGLDASTALIDMQHVTLARGGTVVLRDLSLRIGQHERVAVIGPNGSGKSTLVRAISRDVQVVADPSSSFTILGRDRWNVFSLRAMLGVVSPDLLQRFADDVTVEEVVLSGFFSSLDLWAMADRVTAEMRARATAMLRRLDVVSFAHRPIAALSSGEARRALIARALVHEPRALVFDEPATSLDLPAQRTMRRTLSRLASDGLALVIVTHDLGDIVPEISRVIFMSGGRIVGDGPTDQMLSAERLSRLFGEAVEVGRLADGAYWAG